MSEPIQNRCLPLLIAALVKPTRPTVKPPQVSNTTITFINNLNENVIITKPDGTKITLTPGNTIILPAKVGQQFSFTSNSNNLVGSHLATNPPSVVTIQRPTPVVKTQQVQKPTNRALDPNQQGTRLYPLAHNREISGLKSANGAAISINFINETTDDAVVNWINYNGQRQHYKTLKPAEKYRQETYVNHPWEVVVNGTTTRYLPTTCGEFYVIIGSTDNPTLTPLASSNANLVSRNGAATAINFINQSNVPAEINWINYSGKRERYRTLEPFTAYHQHTFVNHPWEVVAGGKTTRYLPVDATADVYIE